MDHSYFKEKISAYCDSQLTGYELQAIEDHLSECKECQELLEKYRKLSAFVAGHSDFSEADGESESESESEKYWEESALKIEEKIGMMDSEKPKESPIKKSSTTSIIWKFSAVAASIAFVTFLSLKQTDKLDLIVEQDISGELKSKREVQEPVKFEPESSEEVLAVDSPIVELKSQSAQPSHSVESADLDQSEDALLEENKAVDEFKGVPAVTPQPTSVIATPSISKTKKNRVADRFAKEEDSNDKTKEDASSALPLKESIGEVPEEAKRPELSLERKTDVIDKSDVTSRVTISKETVVADGYVEAESEFNSQLKKEIDSLLVEYNKIYATKKISQKKKSTSHKSITLQYTIADPVSGTDSKSDWELVLLDKYFEYANNNEDEKLIKEVKDFFKKYLANEKTLHKDKVREYLKKLAE